jgi:hypothetical protein
LADKKSHGDIASIVRKAGQVVKAADGQEVITSAQPKIFTILEYIESDWGLATRLFPAQRFIVKLYYNLKLDHELPEDPFRRIRVKDPFSGKQLYEFTEYEYLQYLYNEGRCNIGEQDHDRRELVLAIGRRGGKTTLSGIFASYEVYKLLNLYNPQQYFGLPNGNKIQIISVATDKDQASLLFNEVTSHLAKCTYFSPYIANNTLSHVNFRTPYDIEKYGPTARQENGKFVSFNGKATIRVTFKSCIAKGLRGPGNIVIILDEVAHFVDKGNSSAEQIYDAVTPSTAAYSRKNPLTGMPAVSPFDGSEAPVESRIILISSPLGRSGKFYEKFDLAMRGGEGSRNLLAIQAPTWEINPTVPISYFKEKYHANPTTFMVEFGANFSDQARGWIERESDLLACVEEGRRPVVRPVPKVPHQMGIDVGLVNDGTAIYITHVEQNRIVLDYHEVWYAGVDWREANPHLTDPTTPYARTLANVDRLDFDEIAIWIQTLSKRFLITAGLFDRWNGIPLEQKLHKMGLKQFKAEFFTRDMSSKIYQSAKMFLFDERLVLYDYPIPSRAQEGAGATRHSPFIAELLTLQANQISKNVILVAAPDKVGAHDDQADAFVRAVWLSTEVMLNTKYASHGGVHRPHAAPAMSAQRYQKMKARKHGGLGDRASPRLGRSLVRSR